MTAVITMYVKTCHADFIQKVCGDMTGGDGRHEEWPQEEPKYRGIRDLQQFSLTEEGV